MKCDVWYIQRALRAAMAHGMTIFASTLCISECTHIGKEPSDEIKSYFRGIFLSGKVLTLIQADIYVCEEARDLRWNHKIALPGADAIHIASAISSAVPADQTGCLLRRVCRKNPACSCTITRSIHSSPRCNCQGAPHLEPLHPTAPHFCRNSPFT